MKRRNLSMASDSDLIEEAPWPMTQLTQERQCHNCTGCSCSLYIWPKKDNATTARAAAVVFTYLLRHTRAIRLLMFAQDVGSCSPFRILPSIALANESLRNSLGQIHWESQDLSHAVPRLRPHQSSCAWENGASEEKLRPWQRTCWGLQSG